MEQGTYFRTMTPDEVGRPRLGNTSRTLGVRVPQDIVPDGDGYVQPGAGGLSVAPDSMWNLPHHRRPRSLGRGSTGPGVDRVYSVTSPRLSDCSLQVRPDPIAQDIHAFVEPSERTLLEDFRRCLERTKPYWEQAWP